eukprot:15125530-Alexandrium_andersonii.AAC.1
MARVGAEIAVTAVAAVRARAAQALTAGRFSSTSGRTWSRPPIPSARRRSCRPRVGASVLRHRH